ncbi:hypothetical protein R50073_30280 [Maricurvus nonylphenolicus]|uniref:DUF6931 family protein n=1 Tax=Maricurvus nonylphenolicus TaxID=1008307 RepID=UPI0036F37E19
MNDWVKVKAINAAELIQHFELSDEAETALIPDKTPHASVEDLVDANCHYDAIKLIAHGLPKREAVWWACLVARQIQTPDTDEHNINALIAAEAWAKQPTEENRLRCRDLGEKTKYETPASWAATAASWSTGSMAPEGEPEIMPPEYLYAHAVAGGVTLAGVLHNADDPEQSLSQFIAQGVNLAQGGNGSI